MFSHNLFPLIEEPLGTSSSKSEQPMSYKSRKSSPLSRAEREGNARQGYAVSSFFASAEDIPAVISEALPDGKYCTVEEMIKGIRKVENHLLALNTTEGLHFALVDLKTVKAVALTLVLADSSIGLSKELDPAPVIMAEHIALKNRINDVKTIITSIQDGSMSYEEVRAKFDQLPDIELTNTVVSLIGQRVPVVQSMAGPLDLNMEKMPVKFVASGRDHCMDGRVVGGYEEHAGTVIMEIQALKDADARLFSANNRITLRVMDEEHRVNLLLAQLTKSTIQVKVRVPRIPITSSPRSISELRCDLEDIEVLDKSDSLDQIKEAIVQKLQLNLQFNSTPE